MIDNLSPHYRHPDDFDAPRGGFTVVGAVVFSVLALLVLLVACARAAKDGVISYSVPYDPAIFDGVIIISHDDYLAAASETGGTIMGRTLFGLADSLDIPITINLAAGDGNAGRDAAALAAWIGGADVGVHTSPDDMYHNGLPNTGGTPEERNAFIATMTAAEVRTMMQLNIADAQALLGGTVGGPLQQMWTPQSWVYYGNGWTEAALAVGREFFTFQRINDATQGATPTSIYPPLIASASDDWKGFCARKVGGTLFNDERGRGVPIVQGQRDRMPTVLAMKGGDANSSNAAGVVDTNGVWDFCRDIGKNHQIAVVMMHNSGDYSYDEVMWLMVTGSQTFTNIWWGTPRTVMADPILSQAFSRGLTDTLYVSAAATENGIGTWSRPAHIRNAMCLNWTHPVKFKSDETYDLGALVPAATDLYVNGAISITGPSTINVSVASDAADATTTLIKMDPRVSIYDDGSVANELPEGKFQSWNNLTITSTGSSTNDTSAPIRVFGYRVKIKDCVINAGTKYGIYVTTGGNYLRLINDQFICTADISAAGAIVNDAGGYGHSYVGNLFKSITATDVAAKCVGIYHYADMSATVQDTLCNNTFWNTGTNAGTYFYRFDSTNPPVPNTIYYGGNYFRGTILQAKLGGTVMAIATANAVLNDAIEAAHPGSNYPSKNWSGTASISGTDTEKWGGIPLGAEYGTAVGWGSIGATQYTFTPFVWPVAYGTYPEYARYDTVQDILDLVDANKLPRSDSLAIAGGTTFGPWYHFPPPRGTGFADAGMVRCYLTTYYGMAEADRKKLRWYVDGGRYLIYNPAGSTSYQGIWALSSAIPGTETASTNTSSSTWFRLQQPRSMSDVLMDEHYLRMWELWPSTLRDEFKLKADGAPSLSLGKATSSDGLWAAVAKVDATTEATASSTNVASWFTTDFIRGDADMIMLEATLSGWGTLSGTDKAKVKVKVRGI